LLSLWIHLLFIAPQQCSNSQNKYNSVINIGNVGCIEISLITIHENIQNFQRPCPQTSVLSFWLFLQTYSISILPVVLYGCETWSLTLSEEHRLRVFENRVLRRIFGPKRDEVTGEWRKMHNE
jgi:hypothetical protein